MNDDRHLREVQAIARGCNPEEDDINRRTREQVVKLREAAAELREFTDKFEREIENEIRRGEPTATLEFTEEEMHWLIRLAGERGRGMAPFAVAQSVRGKLHQAFTIEINPGGNFHKGPAA